MRRRRTWRRRRTRKRRNRRGKQYQRRGSRKHTRTPHAPRGTTSLRAFEKPAPLVILSPQLANTTANSWMGWSPSAGQPGNRQSPASPSSTYTDRQTEPRTTTTRHCPCIRSGPFRSTSLLAPPRLLPTLRVNTSNHPQRFKNCVSRLANSILPCTREVHEYRKRTAPSAVPTTRPRGQACVMVDSRQHKSEFATSCPDLREGRKRCGKNK